MTFWRPYFLLYLLTLLFVGIGYLGILPPFEGFDETAYYSSIRQVAEEGAVPFYGASFLDKEAADYKGPVAYTSLRPPFDQGLIYSKFFALPQLVEAYRSIYRLPRTSLYARSRQLNWEAQHPPLYYVLMAPFESILERSSFVTRIFGLRLVSYAIALAGVALGLLALDRSGSGAEANTATIGFILYPLALPMFFPEFTRIGNDSLCLLLVGLTAFLLSKWLKRKDDKKLACAIGLVLGLGLLAKAFFVLILVSLAGFLLSMQFRSEDQPAMGVGRWQSLCLIVFPAVLIGSGWYIYQFVVAGSLAGAADEVHLARLGGLFAQLRQNFSVVAVIQGLAVTFVTYVWAGTWSLVRLPVVLYLPLLLLIVGCFGAFAVRLRRLPFERPEWLCAWLFAAFGAGILYHVLIGVAAYGNGNTPGWYFHILMPWTAPALGIGLGSLLQGARTRPFVLGLLVYALVFQVIAIWSQFALFTGCATKGDQKYYVFSGHQFCLDQVPVLLDRLSVLAWPGLAIAGFCGGAIGILLLWRLGGRLLPQA